MRNLFVHESGNYKTSYVNDMKLFGTVNKKVKIAVIVGVLLLVPLFTSNYWIGLLTLCAIASIGAIGLNILTGFTGQISIGVGAFLGVGGYTSAIITSTYGLSFWISLPLAGLITAIVGGIFGLPALRLKGLYLAIATLAAQVIILFIISRWTSVTGGTSGMVLSRPSIGSFTFMSNTSYYYLSIVILLLTILYATNLLRTRVGRAFLAVRDRDIAAQIMGINLFKYKVLAFTFATFICGMAGALLSNKTTLQPIHLGQERSIYFLVVIVLGGLGSLTGTILSTGVLVFYEYWFCKQSWVPEFFAENPKIVYGVILVLIMLFRSSGKIGRAHV